MADGDDIDLGFDAEEIDRAANATERFADRIRQLTSSMAYLQQVQSRMRAATSVDPDLNASRLVDFGSRRLGFSTMVNSRGILYGNGISPFASMRHTIDRMRAENLANDAFVRQFRRYTFFQNRAEAARRWDIVPRGTTAASATPAPISFESFIRGGTRTQSPRMFDTSDAVDAEYTMSGDGYQWRGWGRFMEDLANTRGRMRQASFWGTAGAARGGAIGRAMGFMGNILKFGTILKALTIPVLLLGYTFRKLTEISKKLYATALENFKLFKQSAAYNMLGTGGSASALLRQQRMVSMLGGDAASVSTLNAKLSGQRAMLGYGGNGGTFMEAARLFGVNIAGSGRYGLATNSEFLEAVAEKMGQLDPESQIALKNTVGLSDEMFFAMRGGLASYRANLERSSTLLDQVSKYGGRTGVYGSTSDPYMGNISEEYVRTWGEFKNSLVDLGLVVGKTLLPAFTTLLKVLTFVTDALTSFFNKFAWIGKIYDYINKLFSPEIPVSPPLSHDEMSENLRNERAIIDNYATYNTGNTSTLSINEVVINASEPITNENGVSMSRRFGEGAIDRAIYTMRGLGVG